MYDLGVIVACHLKDKYLTRMYDFRRYGLLNVKDARIKVYFLVGSNEVPQDMLEDTWPYEVKFVRSRCFFDGPKVYDFMLGMTPEEAGTCRWWIKVDDDSVTDVSGQVNKLDEEFDWERPEYIFGDYGPGTCWVFEEAIKRTKHRDRFFLPNTGDAQIFHHEFESCVMSSPCVKKIIEDEECRRFLQILTEPSNDLKLCYHDQGLAVAARFVKVHGSTSLFMTVRPLINNFSLFGGRFTHIHYMHSESPEWPIFLEKLGEMMP